MTRARLALDRTLLLVRRDIFPTLSNEEILASLTETRVRLTVNGRNLATPAGQTAFVTTFLLAAQLGVEIILDAPATPLVAPQPPLQLPNVRSALIDVADKLVQPVRLDGTADIALLFGDTRSSKDADLTLRVAGSSWSCTVDRGDSDCEPWIGAAPIGAALAAVAACAEVFRFAMRRLGAHSGVQPLSEHAITTPSRVKLSLPPLDLAHIDVGQVDLVSAGALTTAALYLLLRFPSLHGSVRVFDPDIAALDNINRYLLLTRDRIGAKKVDVLAGFQTDTLRLNGVPVRLDAENIHGFVPFAPRVLAGVDHIPSRWLIQQNSPDWLGVAATSHFETLISEHVPSSPCAGCLHPRNDGDDGEPIPTISFVSALAGFLLAYRLLRATNIGSEPSATLAYPFNLSAPRGMTNLKLAAHPACPVGQHDRVTHL